MGRYVYYFGEGKAEGRADMRNLLGGKGANLAEMTNLGIPVPPGFTISTEVCDYYYKNGRQYPPELRAEVAENLRRVEQATGMKFGDPANPLLVSVRSGAAASMPGMMDTVLNLGINDQAVEGLIRKTGNPRFAWDAYRRFMQMYGDVVRGVDHDAFEEALHSVKTKKGIEADTDLDADDLKKVVALYRAVFKKHTKEEFPTDPMAQLWGAIEAVFGSWNNDRAIKYRALDDIKGLLGTAVNVQTMVFGNFGEDSGTGVCFTRDPSTGENVFYGEYLMNAQGEDVVAGIRTPLPIIQLRKRQPASYAQLEGLRKRLETHYRDMQDMEFTIQQNKLYMLQTRNGKRTGPAAVKVAVDMVKEGLITKEEALHAREPRAARPAPAPDDRPQGAARAQGDRQGPQRLARRGQRTDRIRRGRGRGLGQAGQEGPADAPGDLARGHRRHERRPGHPHLHRRHDQPRGRRGPRHGHALRRRLQGRQHPGKSRHHPGQEIQRRRLADDRRHHRRGLRRPGGAGQAQGCRRLQDTARVGRRGAPLGGARRHQGKGFPRAHQRRPASRRQGGPRVRRRGRRPLPHRAHVLRRGQARSLPAR